jgi:chromosome segregation ATPase
MISGFEAQQSIDEAFAKLRGDEMRLDSVLRSTSEEAAQLRQERLSQLKALAELKFKLIQSGELAKGLDAAEQRVKALLDRAKNELGDAAQQREDAHANIQRLESSRNERAANCDAAVRSLQAFEAEVAARFADDPAWRALKEGADTAQKILSEADKKAAQAEADRESKKAPYESDRLFMYLWGRKLGTSEYSSGALIRFFDEKIARLINYREARANYAMLNEIPTRLRAHVDQLASALEGVNNKVAAFQQEKVVAAGGAPLHQKASEAKAALDAADEVLQRAHLEFEEIEKQYRAVAGRDDKGAYAEAINLMVDNDLRDDIATLFREAARTKSDEDRAIVEKIDDLTKGIVRADGEVAQLRGRIGEVAARRAEVERARSEFRQRGYNYPGGGFGNEAAINDVLGGILQGVIKGAVLGQVLQQGYRGPPPGWGPPPGRSRPPPGWGGGRPSGPAFPQPSAPPPRSGSSDDGFRTGGSF